MNWQRSQGAESDPRTFAVGSRSTIGAENANACAFIEGVFGSVGGSGVSESITHGSDHMNEELQALYENWKNARMDTKILSVKLAEQSSVESLAKEAFLERAAKCAGLESHFEPPFCHHSQSKESAKTGQWKGRIKQELL